MIQLRHIRAIATLCGLIAALAPAASYAVTTHHYVCADFSIAAGSPTCTSDIVHMSGTDGYVDTGGINLSGGTWYVTMTYTGSGDAQFRTNGTVTDGSYHVFSASLADYAYTVPSNADNRLKLEANSSFSGTLANICVSDTTGQCTVAPPPPSGMGGATSTIEQSQTNLAYAVYMFMIAMFGMVWLMRKH